MLLVSIIIPVYNAEKTISRCLDSVLAQDYQNFECILVDDGSCDFSKNVIENYCSRDKRFLLLQQVNAGPGAARNLGLRFCKGDYITFIDSDDFVHASYLSIMLKTVSVYNADIVQCSVRRFRDRNPIHSKISSFSVCIDGTKECIIAYSQQKCITNYVCGKLFKNEIIINLQFPSLYHGEDKVLIMSCLLQSNRICLLDSELYYYYSNPYSITSRKFSLQTLDDLNAGIILYNMSSKYGYECNSYWAAFIASRAALYFWKLKWNHYPEKYLNRMVVIFGQYYSQALKIRFSMSLKRICLIYAHHWYIKLAFNK